MSWRASCACLLLPLLLQLGGCASPLKPLELPADHALSAASGTAAWAPLGDYLPGSSDLSWFDIQDIGPDALRWRIAMADTATVSLDAQYFIWKQDAVGSLLMERVVAAADRGVRVRLLLDDSFLSGEEELMLDVDAHPNIELRIFNPFEVRSSSMALRYLGNLNDFERTNHRMHNKLLIADGQVAIVGGRNIANEYFDFNDTVNFRDVDLLTTGSILPAISSSFDHYWNSGRAYPVNMIEERPADHDALRHLRRQLRAGAAALDDWYATADNDPQTLPSRWQALTPRLIAGYARLLEDAPLVHDDELPVQAADRISRMFGETRGEVMSISAYLIPSDELLDVAEALTAKGVRIRALTNSLASNNHVPAHTAYRHRRRALLEAGVELYEFRPDAAERSHFEAPGFGADHVGLHAKILVLDEHLVFVGTINTDPRSMALNTEVSLVIDSPALARAILDTFASDFLPENSWRVALDDSGELQWTSSKGTVSRQPAGSAWQRLGDTLFGILPIDAQM